jgi:hypothetical protein
MLCNAMLALAKVALVVGNHNFITVENGVVTLACVGPDTSLLSQLAQSASSRSNDRRTLLHGRMHGSSIGAWIMMDSMDRWPVNIRLI